MISSLLNPQFAFRLLILLLALDLPAMASADSKVDHSNLSAKELLEKVDSLFRSKGSESTVEMEVVTPNWERTMKLRMWTKGLDYTFIRIEAPAKDKGVQTLKREGKMWNYFPRINKVVKVPPSMMMGSWMGSDFTNDDLVKDSTFADDYSSEITKQTKDRISIALKPKRDAVSLWGKIEVEIAADSLLPIEQVYYDEKGEKIRVMKFKEIGKLGGRTIPKIMELVPLTKKGHRTVVRYLDATFDVDVPDLIFRRTHLQSR